MSVRNLPIIALDFKSADEVHTFFFQAEDGIRDVRK